MKTLIAVILAVALMACGKKNASTTPPPTEQTLEGTGGSTYGGPKMPAPDAAEGM